MIAQYELNFGTVYVFDTFLMSIIDEDVAFRTEENNKLLHISRKHFKDRPYGYISYRAYSYSVDPVVYVESSKETNLVAIAVVAMDPINKLGVSVEKLFFNRELKYFENIDDAKKWIKQTLKYSACS